MLGLLLAVLPLVQVLDASNGRPLNVPVSVSAASDAHEVMLEADGTAQHYAVFHGIFARNALPRTIRLTRLTRDEQAGLARVNTFRARYGLPALVADENLTETARYWSLEERRAQRIGHTCVSLGSPPGCIEFDDYFHRLPGAPAGWSPGQNAAFDPDATWLAPEALFEAERNARGERGHFLNLIHARLWIGLGEARIPGYGAYFAMNLL